MQKNAKLRCFISTYSNTTTKNRIRWLNQTKNKNLLRKFLFFFQCSLWRILRFFFAQWRTFFSSSYSCKFRTKTLKFQLLFICDLLLWNERNCKIKVWNLHHSTNGNWMSSKWIKKKKYWENFYECLLL